MFIPLTRPLQDSEMHPESQLGSNLVSLGHSSVENGRHWDIQTTAVLRTRESKLTKGEQRKSV